MKTMISIGNRAPHALRIAIVDSMNKFQAMMMVTTTTTTTMSQANRALLQTVPAPLQTMATGTTSLSTIANLLGMPLPERTLPVTVSDNRRPTRRDSAWTDDASEESAVTESMSDSQSSRRRENSGRQKKGNSDIAYSCCLLTSTKIKTKK